MKIIKIYYLEYCRNCKYLIEKIEKEEIKIEKINADDNLDEVEQIENMINSSIYPIITISENSKLNTIIGYNINQSIVGSIKILSYFTVNEVIKILKY